MTDRARSFLALLPFHLAGAVIALTLVFLAMPPLHSAAAPEIDPVVASDHAPLVDDPPKVAIAAPPAHNPPTLVDKALRTAFTLLQGAFGGVAVLGAARGLDLGRRRWPSWRKGWIGAQLATAIGIMTIAGTALLAGSSWYAAMLAAGTALATGRALAATAPGGPTPQRRAGDVVSPEGSAEA